MDIEKQKNFIIRFIYWLFAAGVFYVAIKYIMPLLMPFILGFLVSVATKPMVDWIAGVTKMERKWTAGILLIIVYSIAATLLILSGVRIATMVSHFMFSIPEFYRTMIEPSLGQALNTVTALLHELDPSLQAGIQTISGDLISSLANLVTGFSASAINWLTGVAGAVPAFVINFIMAVISSFFISLDYPGIQSFLRQQIKPGHLRILRMVRENAVLASGKYMKAYFILMIIMYVELQAGFWLIGISNSTLLALGIAIFDAAPVLGTGGILIPWAIVDLIVGRYRQGLQLLILYGVVSLIRNVVEPRIVGRQIGLHPLITLLCMYIGASLFGFVGFLGMPISAVILKNLNDKGVIHLFKNENPLD